MRFCLPCLHLAPMLEFNQSENLLQIWRPIKNHQFASDTPSPTEDEMESHWYALRSKPHKEFLLHEQLLAREIECFFPRIQVTPVNPRSRKEQAYFPGYLFVKTNLDEIGTNTFKWMPYAQHLVSFDGVPSIVPIAIIEQLRHLLTQINALAGQKAEKFTPGEQVVVAEGPFEGYQGIFDIHLSGTDRAKILIELLGNRQLPVELDISQIASKKKGP